LAQFKGTVFESTRSFTEQTFGRAGVEKVLERLSPADRHALSHVQAMGWCPVGPVLEYHHALDRVHGIGDLSLCFEAGRFSAGWSLNRVLKVFLRFRSPVWLVEKATSVWDRYHDTGRWVVKTPAPNRIIGELHDFAVRDDAFCARLRGWLHGAVEMTGGAQTRITEVRCAGRGEGQCVFELAWTGSSS
jgi:hypothetical protein